MVALLNINFLFSRRAFLPGPVARWGGSGDSSQKLWICLPLTNTRQYFHRGNGKAVQLWTPGHPGFQQCPQEDVSHRYIHTIYVSIYLYMSSYLALIQTALFSTAIWHIVCFHVCKFLYPVRSPEGNLSLYCKGADTIIYERLHQSCSKLMDVTTEHLNVSSISVCVFKERYLTLLVYANCICT